MKTLNQIRITLLIAAALLTQSAFVSRAAAAAPTSGTLVLDYVYPGGTWSENWGLAVAPSGVIYASGYADAPDNYHALVIGSGDAGNTWQGPLDDFAPPGRTPWYLTQAGSIASDAVGNLYVAGVTYDYDYVTSEHWYVRRSADAGASWASVDEFNVGAIDGGDLTGITVDTAGNVYVCGQSHDTGRWLWTVRKGNGGTSFSTIDASIYGQPNAIFAHPTAGIFVVGTRSIVIKNKSSSAWVVRRSTNGGATWSDVDTFQLSSSLYSSASGIGADSHGNLYVVGRGNTTSRGNDVYHWIVRKSTNSGSSWSTVDDFQPTGNWLAPRCFAATPTGDLYVAGTLYSVTGYHWLLRKSVGGIGPWSTIDDYQYAGASTVPHAIAADTSGNLFVGGTGGDHWLIKKY